MRYNDRGMNGRTKVHLEKLLSLQHWDWWELPRVVHRDLEGEVVPVPSEFQVPEDELSEDRILDPHKDLAKELERSSEESILLEWETWLERSQAWMAEAVRKTDALPQEDGVGGRARASGAYRLKMAIPLTLLRMKAPGHGLARRVLRLGICEEDPSDNRDFIEPAIRILGMQAVLEMYLEAFASGDDNVRGGVANAIYWTRYETYGIAGSEHPGEDQSRVMELRRQLRDAMITAFAEAEESRNLHLMQTSISMIGYCAPPDDASRERFQQCIDKARMCRDPYIRSRVGQGTGTGSPPLLMAKPHRPPLTTPWWKLW
jgi:hypothetical protein